MDENVKQLASELANLNDPKEIGRRIEQFMASVAKDQFARDVQEYIELVNRRYK